jgi:competence protein ComEC
VRGNSFYFAAAALAGLVIVLEGNMALLLFAVLFSTFAIIKRFSKMMILLLFLTLLIFACRGYFAGKANHSVLSGAEKTFQLELAEMKIDGNRVSINSRDRKTGEKLLLVYKLDSEKNKLLLRKYLVPGLVCRVDGTLEKPMKAGNPNGFDYRLYLERKKTFWLLEADSLLLSRCSGPNSHPVAKLKRLRQSGIAYIEAQFPESLAPLAAALVFGERGLMDTSLLEDYQKLGIVHLLAISGLHVGLLAGMILYTGKRAGLTSERMKLLLLLFLPVYAVLTGGSPSVTRAVLMLMCMLIYSLAARGKKKFQPIDAVSSVFAACLFFSPYIVFEPGFQLSFCVSFALIISAPSIFKNLNHWISQSMAVSLVAQLASAPIILIFFYEISIFALFANLLYIPFFSFVLLPGILFGFLFHILSGENAGLILNALDWSADMANIAAGKLGSLPGAVMVLGKPSGPALFLYMTVVPALLVIWEKKKKHFYIKMAAGMLLLFSFQPLEQRISPKGEITFLDVGQGDSILVSLPYGKGNYLIDTGGRLHFETEEWEKRKEIFDPGKDIVVPFLKSKGISRLDRLILTHGDADHIGGAAGVLDEIKIDEIVFPSGAESGELEKLLIRRAEELSIPVVYAGSGSGWQIGSSSFQIISPIQGREYGSKNDGSLVILAKAGGLRWLFTGDLEEEGESWIIQNYPHLRADILKAGHHGSNSSSSSRFLRHIEPKAAVISAGRNNRYGHPHPEVLSRLSSEKIKILRTDLHGAITYTFTEKAGTFSLKLP